VFSYNEFLIKVGVCASGLERFIVLANIKGWGRPTFVIEN
jgi:hypothetical protein